MYLPPKSYFCIFVILSQTLTPFSVNHWFLYVTIVCVHFTEFYINEIIQIIYFLFDFLTQYNYFQIHSCPSLGSIVCSFLLHVYISVYPLTFWSILELLLAVTNKAVQSSYGYMFLFFLGKYLQDVRECLIFKQLPNQFPKWLKFKSRYHLW